MGMKEGEGDQQKQNHYHDEQGRLIKGNTQRVTN
jgi:hypothetical protein